MQITAAELGQILDGDVVGDPKVVVSKPCKIEEGEKGAITFLSNPKYEPYIYDTKASVVLVSRDFIPSAAVSATMIKVDDVYTSLGKLLNSFGGKTAHKGIISKQAHVAEKAVIGDNVSIGTFSIISDEAEIGENTEIGAQVFVGKKVSIGKDVRIYPGVKIYDHCVIGDRCIIHSNVVIGSDGFGFSKEDNGSYTKIAQIGNVIIENDVEVGAGTCIDRATMGSTIIRSGVKLDNLIQIAHNAEIDINTVIAAQSGISGSTKLGKNCMLGGQVGVAGHIKIADGTMIQAKSGIASEVKKENSRLYGYPAIDYISYLKSYTFFKKLPDIIQTIRQLRKDVDNLKSR